MGVDNVDLPLIDEATKMPDPPYPCPSVASEPIHATSCQFELGKKIQRFPVHERDIHLERRSVQMARDVQYKLLDTTPREVVHQVKYPNRVGRILTRLSFGGRRDSASFDRRGRLTRCYPAG